jgi:hypothetical protein
VDPRAGLDEVEKRKFVTLPRLKLQPLGRVACSQSLYRLRSVWSLRKEQFQLLDHTSRYSGNTIGKVCTISI